MVNKKIRILSSHHCVHLLLIEKNHMLYDKLFININIIYYLFTSESSFY